LHWRDGGRERFKKAIGFISRPMVEALRKQHLEDKLIYSSPAGFINIIITFGI